MFIIVSIKKDVNIGEILPFKLNFQKIKKKNIIFSIIQLEQDRSQSILL